MRKLYFLLPGTTEKFYCGGLFAELKTVELAREVCEKVCEKTCGVEVVTYRQREAQHPYLDDMLQQYGSSSALTQSIFVVSWGFDVPKLLKKLKPYPVVYHAHSTGYGFPVPPSVPIIAVSRNTMSYWGQAAHNAPIFWLPNCLADDVTNRQLERDIDVLVQARKSSEYLTRQLIPALQARCKVMVLDQFVDDLMELFNRSKVYLYDSAEYWAQHRLTEGFGLPPMEAIACGCHVFSSVNHALADYLDPGFNCHKIATYATGYDVQRILKVVNQWQPDASDEALVAPYRAEHLVPRFQTILNEINQFFDYQQKYPSDIPSLDWGRSLYLYWDRLKSKMDKILAQR
ncbi:MAG: glycosyltransferase [Cyanothece sp. SIO2G6]|nr:glycosyltransferase [Cyanothece sp. SIO2G6]